MKIRTKVITISSISLPVLILSGCMVFLLLYLQTNKFQALVRSEIISRVEKATGLSCAMKHSRFNIFRGRLEIDELTLSPRNATPGIVALRVPKIRAAASISSLWNFRIRLSSLDVLQPQVEFRSADSNSSWSPEEMLKTLKISLRLEAAKVRIQDGVIQVNQRTAPFNLLLHNLDCEIRYSDRLPSYKLHVAYDHSNVFWEGRHIAHDLEANLDLSVGGIEIEFFKFRYGTSLLTGSGSFGDWNDRVLLIRATGLYDARDLILAHPSINEGSGTLRILADVRYDRSGVSAKGRFSSGAGGYRKMKFHDLAGRFEVKQNVLFLREVSGGIVNGNFQAKADIQLREANRATNQVDIAAKSVPLIEIGKLLDLPLVTFENPADGSATATWQRGRDLKVACNLNLGESSGASSPAGYRTPFAGSAEFTYFETGEVQVASADLKSSDSFIRASKNQDGSSKVHLSTNRIAEPVMLFAQFSAAVTDLLSKQPDLVRMKGNFQFFGDTRIKSSTDVSYIGNVLVKNSGWRSSVIDELSAQADFAPPYLKLRSMTVRSDVQEIRGDVDLELADSEHISRFEFRGDVHQISIASFRDFGMDPLPVGGRLSGRGLARFADGAWAGDGELLIDEGAIRGESFERLRANLKLADNRLRISRAEARRGKTVASAEGDIDLGSRRMNVSMRLDALPLQQLPAISQASKQLSGLIGAAGVLTGTTDDPAFSGKTELNALHYGSWDLGNGTGNVELKSGIIKADLRIRSEYGNLSARGHVSMEAGNPGTVNIEFDNLDVRKIAAERIPPYLKDVSSALSGKMEMEGKFGDLASLKIRGEIDGASFKIQDYELRNDGRLQFSVINRNIRIESVRFVGEGTSFDLSGRIPLEETMQLDLNLNGDVNLRVLDGEDKKLEARGRAALNIRASGSTRDPLVIGRASLKDAELDYAKVPVRFSELQGDIVFSRDLVRFENIQGHAGSGTVRLSGVLEHRNAVLQSLNVSISARNARLPYPKDFRSVVNADLYLNGTGDVRMLTGEVDVIRAEYTRDFNLLEQLAGGGVTQSGPLTTDPYLRDLRLNVEIRSDKGLVIDNELANLRGSTRLMLRGTPAYPSLTGRVEASEGTIFFRGSRFEINRAAADFVGRNWLNPLMEVRAEADVKTYRLILDAVGELDNLNLNVTSDPPMSTVDILSMLTTGKRDSSAATTQQKSEIVGMSAASVLSENLTGVIGKRMQRIFGLESFRVDPFLAGAENDPTARITVSERISRDLVVTFSRNLTTNQDQIVVIEYDVTKDLSLLATRDEDGKYGLDFRFRKRWR